MKFTFWPEGGTTVQNAKCLGSREQEKMGAGENVMHTTAYYFLMLFLVYEGKF